MSSGTTSRFGCFGCFWLGALLAGTVTTAGILYWMQPAWLQPVLFWQTPPFPEEVVFLPEQLLPAPQPEAVPPLESLAELWTDLAASGIYDPATGLSLETLEGSQVVFPPGSVNDAHPITMTPVSSLPSEMSEDTVVPVGPALSLRVADQEHWTFDRPIQVSIPFPDDYLPTDLPPHDLAIAVWEDTAWRVLPTTVDPGTGTLSADVPHASVVATVLILKYLAAGTAMTVGIGINFEPGQAVLKLLQSEVDTTYKTPNFAVHYISRAKSPVAAPPADNLYLAATTSGARQVGQHPLYVTDLGRYFEEGRSWLPDVHHRVSEATLIRWDVFVLPLANEYGVSGLGGPVVIDNDMRFSASDPLPEHLEFEMRRTTVHELIHVAQDDFFNRFQYQRWWIESTAEYLSTYLVTRKMGIEDPKPFYYIGTDFACPALGWDSNSGISHWYSYAKFMESMEAKGLDVPGAIRKISNDGTVTERELSATLRSLPPPPQSGRLPHAVRAGVLPRESVHRASKEQRTPDRSQHRGANHHRPRLGTISQPRHPGGQCQGSQRLWRGPDRRTTGGVEALFVPGHWHPPGTPGWPRGPGRGADGSTGRLRHRGGAAIEPALSGPTVADTDVQAEAQSDIRCSRDYDGVHGHAGRVRALQRHRHPWLVRHR
jgi:hypothetical protein